MVTELDINQEFSGHQQYHACFDSYQPFEELFLYLTTVERYTQLAWETQPKSLDNFSIN